MLKQYQDVELTKDMMSDETLGEPVMLRKGQKGVIVEIHKTSDVPYPGYDVEFFNDDGDTVAVMIVREEDIKAASKKPSAEEVA